jgi:hypothetical protein
MTMTATGPVRTKRAVASLAVTTRTLTSPLRGHGVAWMWARVYADLVAAQPESAGGSGARSLPPVIIPRSCQGEAIGPSRRMQAAAATPSAARASPRLEPVGAIGGSSGS